MNKSASIPPEKIPKKKNLFAIGQPELYAPKMDFSTCSNPVQ
jgi:hypothetical protein